MGHKNEMVIKFQQARLSMACSFPVNRMDVATYVDHTFHDNYIQLNKDEPAQEKPALKTFGLKILVKTHYFQHLKA